MNADLKLQALSLMAGGFSDWSKTPFHYDGCSIATDGHRLICFRETIGDFKAPTLKEATFANISKWILEPVAGVPVSALELREFIGELTPVPPPSKCKECGGRKTVECSCSHCGHDHEYECEDCDDNGMVTHKRPQRPVRLGAAYINANFLADFLPLVGDATVHVKAESEKDIAFFWGDGWMLLVMPCRADEGPIFAPLSPVAPPLAKVRA